MRATSGQPQSHKVKAGFYSISLSLTQEKKKKNKEQENAQQKTESKNE